MNLLLKKVLYGKLGYGNSNTGYSSYNNLYPTYDCYNELDRLSISSEHGENVLNNSIGLITLDELKMSGFLDKSNFLHSKYSYYTMSPNGVDAYVFIAQQNILKESKVTANLGVRPVITLVKNVKIKSGDGSLTSPFTIY